MCLWFSVTSFLNNMILMCYNGAVILKSFAMEQSF